MPPGRTVPTSRLRQSRRRAERHRLRRFRRPQRKRRRRLCTAAVGDRRRFPISDRQRESDASAVRIPSPRPRAVARRHRRQQCRTHPATALERRHHDRSPRDGRAVARRARRHGAAEHPLPDELQRGAQAIVVVTADRLLFVTDFRYVTAIAETRGTPYECPGLELVTVESSYDATLAELLAGMPSARIGFEAANLSWRGITGCRRPSLQAPHGVSGTGHDRRRRRTRARQEKTRTS